MTEQTPTQQPRKVLLVDDETGFLGVLSRRLQRRGFDVTTAENGAEALRALRGTFMDAAVVDLKMHDMDGFELLRVCRRMTPEMPVIILTGHGSAAEAEEGMRLGAAGYLLKPCELDDLVRCLSAVITGNQGCSPLAAPTTCTGGTAPTE